jgi:CelD/BcsL family acetyltransferase involved in cellulose biosynthesis
MSESQLASGLMIAGRKACPAGVSLRALSGSDLDQGLQEWRGIESRVGDVPLMCSHLWTSTWLRTYRDVVPSTILIASVDGQAVGAALVTRGVGQKSGPIPLRTLHVGTAGEPLGESVCVEYNELLVAPAHRRAFIRALQTWISQQKGVDEVRLDGWSTADAAPWNESASPAQSRIRDCAFFDLSQVRDPEVEPLQLLGRSTRQNLRRLVRKYGRIETTWAESMDDADDILSELISLHQARWNASGQPGAFASRRFEEFQRQLLVQGFSDGKVVLFRARHDGETIGCLFLLVDRGRMLDYLSGFASFDRKPSPGLITHYLCLTEAAHRGYRAYDFLVGDKRHKDNLSTDVQQLTWATWRRPTLRNQAIDVLKAVRKLRGGKKPSLTTGAAVETPDEDTSSVQEAGLRPAEALSSH